MPGIFRALRSAVGILAIAVLAPLGFCVALPIGINEMKAATWAGVYDGIDHPLGTERIALRYGVTKISNGDNCDFVLMEARSYRTGGEPAIRAFYQATDDLGAPFRSRLHPSFDDDLVLAGGFVLDVQAQLRLDLASSEHGPYYVLEAYAVVENAPPLIDWRCP